MSSVSCTIRPTNSIKRNISLLVTTSLKLLERLHKQGNATEGHAELFFVMKSLRTSVHWPTHPTVDVTYMLDDYNR